MLRYLLIVPLVALAGCAPNVRPMGPGVWWAEGPKDVREAVQHCTRGVLKVEDLGHYTRAVYCR